MKKSRRDTSGTREGLLAATRQVIIARRSIDISLADISANSGINTALVQYHFGGKSGLFLELLRRAILPALDKVDQLKDANISPVDKMRHHIFGIIGTYAQAPYANRLFHYLLVENPEKYGPILSDELSKPTIELQDAILSEGEGLGLFRKTDRMFFYLHLLGACDEFAFGHESMRRYFGVETVTEKMWRGYAQHVSDTILGGLVIQVGVTNVATAHA